MLLLVLILIFLLLSQLESLLVMAYLLVVLIFHQLFFSGNSSVILEELLLFAAFPAAIIITSALLDRYSELSKYRRLFSLALPIAAGALILTGPGLANYFEAAHNIISTGNLAKELVFSTALFSKTFFCAALAGLALMLFVSTCELPMHWLLKATTAKTILPFAAFRLLFLLMGGALAFNVILALFVHELWPTSLI